MQVPNCITHIIFMGVGRMIVWTHLYVLPWWLYWCCMYDDATYCYILHNRVVMFVVSLLFIIVYGSIFIVLYDSFIILSMRHPFYYCNEPVLISARSLYICIIVLASCSGMAFRSDAAPANLSATLFPATCHGCIQLGAISLSFWSESVWLGIQNMVRSVCFVSIWVNISVHIPAWFANLALYLPFRYVCLAGLLSVKAYIFRQSLYLWAL